MIMQKYLAIKKVTLPPFAATKLQKAMVNLRTETFPYVGAKPPLPGSFSSALNRKPDAIRNKALF